MLLNLFEKSHSALLERDPSAKFAATKTLQAQWDTGRLDWEQSSVSVEPIPEPGRPERPILVSPRDVERRQISTPEGRAALIHAIAHIEFNAINLALDAVYRFRDLPREYYGDWLKVAVEEAYHFSLLRDHLDELGFEYGAFTAHNGLWDMAVKSAHDPLVRMALVPRVLEARGLDAAPALIAKLRSAGDARAVEILEIIRRDEIDHVRIGNRWYAYLCAQRGVDPVKMFRALLREYNAPRIRSPIDVEARRRAGFSESEILWLQRSAQTQ